ncbi:hypothetical protein IEQ44_05980 [Nocardioides sp. Y6]|uniref:Uncharacterized protein n=1 Tax=Nocardioides malaquae TaxID=2773426 RepID=A0ABR9RSS1_9ACTN|nr:hypothetical protein [Nocardioides malaquae]MBE7324195.1 hypothetical protein [Nocardioides malaquae]
MTGALLTPTTSASAEPLPAPVVLQDRLNDTEWVGKKLQKVVAVKRNRTFTVALNRRLAPGTRILRVVFVPAKDSVSKPAKRQRVHVVKR